MRKNLRHFVSLSVTSLLSMLFVFALIPKLFAQTVRVGSFTYFSSLLADNSQSGITIQIITPTIISGDNYNGCGQTKTIIGMADGSVLDGVDTYYGIYGSGGGQNIYLSNITMCNFRNSATAAPSWDQKNGANVYLNGNVNIISNTISGGGGSFGDRGRGLCRHMYKWFKTAYF
jgi:hypothetical protein